MVFVVFLRYLKVTLAEKCYIPMRLPTDHVLIAIGEIVQMISASIVSDNGITDRGQLRQRLKPIATCLMLT
jgi:hypothetical protein